MHWDERKTFQEDRAVGTRRHRAADQDLRPGISQEGERLKLSAHERWPGEERPVVHYEYLQVSVADVQHDIDAMVALLHRITDRRALEPAVWQEIKATGAALYHRLLTPAIQDKLRASSATDLLCTSMTPWCRFPGSCCMTARPSCVDASAWDAW